MQKVETLSGKKVFVNTNGLRTAETFKSKKDEHWIALNYGDVDKEGNSTNVLVGPFKDAETAEKTIESLM